MAVITIAASVNWSTAGIVNTDDVVVSAGVVLTLDTAGIAKSLTLNGSLAISRSISTSLTLTGNLTENDGSVYDAGTVASPLLTGVTHDLIISCTTAGQYGIVSNNLCAMTSKSVDVRNPFTTLTAASSTNIIDVVDASGWKVGDTLVFESTIQGLGTDAHGTTISAITANHVTLTNALPYTVGFGFFVANTTNNITIKSSDATEAFNSKNPYWTIIRNAGSVLNSIDLQDMTIRGFGRNSFGNYGIRLQGSYASGRRQYGRGSAFTNCVFANVHSAFSTQHGRATLTNCALVNDAQHAVSNINTGITYNQYAADFDISNILVVNFSQAFIGDVNALLATNTNGVNMVKFNAAYASKARISSGVVRRLSGSVDFKSGLSAATIYTGMAFSKYTAITQYLSSTTSVMKSCTLDVLTNAIFPSYTYAECRVLDINGDPTQQTVIKDSGYIHRDTTIGTTPTSKPASIRFESRKTDYPLVYEIAVTLIANKSLSATASCSRNATYNGASQPALRIKADGAESVVALGAGVAADALTPITTTLAAAAISRLVTVSIEATGTTGAAWFDTLAIDGTDHDIGSTLFAGGTEISNVIDITDTGVNLTLTGLQPGSDVVILAAGTNTVLVSVDQNISASYTYSNASSITIDIGIIKPGFITKYIYGFVLNSKAASIPINQSTDRSYV